MRPPLVWISVAFGAGLWAGLGSLGAWGVGMWAVGASVLIGALSVARQAPAGAAVGFMGGAGGRAGRARGGWIGDARRGVLVARRVRQLEGEAQGRGALRDRLARRTTELFGARAPLVAALVFAPNAALDPDVRERYARSGLAHILSISGLHVGFLAAWLALILRRLGLSPGARAGAAASLLVAYLWLLAFPAPATRAAIMLVAA